MTLLGGGWQSKGSCWDDLVVYTMAPGQSLGMGLAAKPRHQRGADPTALTLLLGTLPLPMAWGALA